jgi:hypothetical protein
MKNLISVVSITGIAPHSASSWLTHHNPDVRAIAEVLMEENDTLTDYATLDCGNVMTDNGIATMLCDTMSYGDGNALCEMMTEAQTLREDYAFVTLAHWFRNEPGEEGILTIYYFQ